MSSMMSFLFNEVKLCVVIINEKPWTRGKEVCKAFEYNNKTSSTVKNICSKENYAYE